MLIERIVSGGQTGADRAGLDWAIGRGLPHEGWCPRGRRAEDGAIGEEYRLRETEERGYLSRTEKNVRDSDGTAIISVAAQLSGGSLATKLLAEKLGKPWIHLSRSVTEDPGKALRAFVVEEEIRVLNVAGPRGSGEPEVGEFVKAVLDAALG